MNWKNLLENLIYIAAIGIIIMANNYIIIGGFENMVNEAIAKETMAINHSFQTEIRKLKAKHGEVEFDIRPNLDSKIAIEQTADTLQDTGDKREGIFKRLFGKKKQQ